MTAWTEGTPSRIRLLPLVAILATTTMGAGRRAHRPQPAGVVRIAPASGRVAGTVTLSTALGRRRPSFRIYADAGPGSVPPQPRTDPAAELRNVVIYIESVPPGTIAAVAGEAIPRRAVMAQTGERFVPHVLPVPRGAVVEFPNQDDVFHNVFSLSGAATFDLGRYPKGASRPWEFGKTGVVQVFCHIHADMSAVVLVLANAFYAVPDQGGRYAIDNLPPGAYTIIAWHERIRPVTRRFIVAEGQTTTLDFNIPLPEPTP